MISSEFSISTTYAVYLVRMNYLKNNDLLFVFFSARNILSRARDSKFSELANFRFDAASADTPLVASILTLGYRANISC